MERGRLGERGRGRVEEYRSPYNVDTTERVCGLEREEKGEGEEESLSRSGS